jgi:dUTP pyrophosphatase
MDKQVVRIFVDPEIKAQIPEYQHEGDAGADVFAASSHILGPGKSAMVRTGIYMELPEGVECQVP